MSHRLADEALFDLPEPQASLMVNASITGMQTYFSTGVSILVAIMAAHRLAASQQVKPAIRDRPG